MNRKLKNPFPNHRVNTIEDNNVNYTNSNICAMSYRIKQLEAQLKITKKELYQKIKDIAIHQLNIFGDWDLVIPECKLDEIFNIRGKHENTNNFREKA